MSDPQVFDLTATLDPETLDRPAEEMAAFDAIAPERLAFVGVSTTWMVTDVRTLGDREGFAAAAKGDYFGIEYTTVLEDGFVVSTERIRPEDTRAAWMQIVFVRHIDPGYRIVRTETAKEALEQHVAFVKKTRAARGTAIFPEQDKALYFTFRRTRSHRIRALVATQVLAAVNGGGIFLVAMTRRHSPLLVLTPLVVVLFFWLGAVLFGAWRWGRPMLNPARG